ncbi:MAG TPA: hypothetical protein VGO74_00150 [Modestobacter sp.]|nr:hypothetical protein [Modestobacter sp.]
MPGEDGGALDRLRCLDDHGALVFGGYTAVALLVRTVLVYSRDTD